MVENPRPPFFARMLLRIVDWVGTLQKGRELRRNVERDARLNTYKCKLESVIDDWKLDFMCGTIAENERQARQLATAWGREQFPAVVGVGGDGSEKVQSPFAVQNFASVETAWAVTLI